MNHYPNPYTILYRAVGQRELELIAQSGFTAFPPRRPEQPIFYPVLNEEYATQIARDWNTNDAGNGYVGYVTRFDVAATFLSQYEIQTVGRDGLHEGYYIPADDLPAFNAAIKGTIDVVDRFWGANAAPIRAMSFVGTATDTDHLCRLIHSGVTTVTAEVAADLDSAGFFRYATDAVRNAVLRGGVMWEYLITPGAFSSNCEHSVNRLFDVDSEEVAEMGFHEDWKIVESFFRAVNFPHTLLYEVRTAEHHRVGFPHVEFEIRAGDGYTRPGEEAQTLGQGWSFYSERSNRVFNWLLRDAGMSEQAYMDLRGNETVVAFLTPEQRDICLAARLMRP